MILPDRFHSPWGSRRDFEIAILDANFDEVERVTTTAAIQHTDQHDFLIKENGNYIFMAYEPAPHDLSEFLDPHGDPYSVDEQAEDSLIEEVNPDGEQVFLWNTYDHMYLGDCMLDQFPANYAHLNNMQLVDGGIVASFRNCGQVLGIDGTTGAVEWRLGRSTRSDAEWEALGVPPPLKIVGDPYVEFCGQHSPKLLSNGHLLLFDNGRRCRDDPQTGEPRRPDSRFSRVVEYALDLDRGTATFVRHHSLHGGFDRFTQYQGIVESMDNQNWLISWGWTPPNGKPADHRPDTSVTEYNPTTGQELLSLTLSDGGSGTPPLNTRSYALPFEALAKQPEALSAAFPESAYSSTFSLGASDAPTVVVEFSEPVADFPADTPSVIVQGATVAGVSPHLVAGEAADAYLFTLTPAGDGPVTFNLRAGELCSAGGICTRDGTTLSSVPAPYVIAPSLRVSFTQTAFSADEGESAAIAVSLSAPYQGLQKLVVPILVAATGTASAADYTAPGNVGFVAGESRRTVQMPIGDDALIEGDETVTLSIGDLPEGVVLGDHPSTTVTITDADRASLQLSISDSEVGEGASVELTVSLRGDATFAAAQTIDLVFEGSSAEERVDFVVEDAAGRTLSTPHALNLVAGARSVRAVVRILDDTQEEVAERIVVRAKLGTAVFGIGVITIAANDAPPVPTNNPPAFREGLRASRSLAENAGSNEHVGRPLEATDVDPGDTLTYSLSGGDAGSFTLVRASGQIRTRPAVAYDYEAKSRYEVTVTASDGEAEASIDVTITVDDVGEPPDAPPAPTVTPASPSSLEVMWTAPPTPDRPPVGSYDLRYKQTEAATFTDGPPDVRGTRATIDGLTPGTAHEVQVRARNKDGDGAWSPSGHAQTAVVPVVSLALKPASISPGGVSTVTATVSPASPTAFKLNIWVAAFPPVLGHFTVSANNVLGFAANETQSTGLVEIKGITPIVVNVTATVSQGATVRPPPRLQLTIAGSDDPDPGPTPEPGPGPTGGGPSGPSPSELDFEWAVKHDIEALDAANAAATGVWSDGETLWVANNPDGAGDGVYAYDLETGERVEEREFELDDANRAPRGLWSDGTVIWVSDSGRDKLFAHDLASGERLPDSDLALHPDNDDPRGIWSGGETMWVLDGRDDALFAYDLASGQLLAVYELDPANGDPRGLWSDGVTIWVSDDGAKRLFAYRLPLLPEEAADSDVEDADADGKELERVRDEEFTKLSRASNNSPRGIWSDGDVIYVADQSDDRVYSYNMPDAIDARLASLSLSGVEIGEFLRGREEYAAVVAEAVTETTVEAEALQRRTTVVIEPPDADEEAEGHQVALEGVEAITVTVTSADGSRGKTYLVSFPERAWDPARDPWPHCLRGAVSEGFSLVVFAGGGVDELSACAESREIVAFYTLHEGVYVSYLVAAPDFVNRAFRELFGDGLPLMTPLVAGSDGPPSADPFGGDLDGAGQPWPHCLRGEVAEGFSIVVFAGGSVADLVACAESRAVTALYILHNGEWVSYILGAPEFANLEFRELYADGLPALTPLVAKSEGAPAAN